LTGFSTKGLGDYAQQPIAIGAELPANSRLIDDDHRSFDRL